MKTLKDLLVKANIASIVSGRLFFDNALWDLLPSIVENYATSLVKAKGEPTLLFGLDKIVASFYSRFKVLKASPLPALGEVDGEEGKAQDERDEDKAGDASDKDADADTDR